MVTLFIPLGAFVALRPTLARGADGKRKWHFLNLVLAALLLIGFVTLTVAVGDDIYKADILKIPNSD